LIVLISTAHKSLLLLDRVVLSASITTDVTRTAVRSVCLSVCLSVCIFRTR